MSRKLTKELIRSRTGNDNFESIKNLNLWGNNIDDISLLKEMPLLEIISLSMNHIQDLSVFTHLKNVKELYLKDNKISDFKQIEYLKHCPKLEILVLADNPISKDSVYSTKIFEILPFLRKLDDIENSDWNKNSSPARLSFPQTSLILFKKLFPKKGKKAKNIIRNDLNSDNNNNNDNAIKEYKNKKEEKIDLLNKSFQKKKIIGTFRKLGNKKNNLDLSVDYTNDVENKELTIDPNKSVCLDEYKNKITDKIMGRYNKKVVGKFKKDQIKSIQTKMMTYQEFDAPIKKEENKKKLNDKNNNNTISNENKTTNDNCIKDKNGKEEIVIQSIKILLDTLNLSELKIVNENIQTILKDKNG